MNRQVDLERSRGVGKIRQKYSLERQTEITQTSWRKTPVNRQGRLFDSLLQLLKDPVTDPFGGSLRTLLARSLRCYPTARVVEPVLHSRR